MWQSAAQNRSKKGKIKWFQTCSSGNACFQLTHFLQSSNGFFYWQINVLLNFLTSVTGLSTCTHNHNACRQLLSHSTNVEMCYTAKTKMHVTLSFQQFGQKIRKCSLHTGAPHFRHANLALFRCNVMQIWQRFLAVSGSWTCAGCRWRQIRKCRPTFRWWTAWRGEATSCCFTRPCCSQSSHSEIFHLIIMNESFRPRHLKTFEKA